MPFAPVFYKDLNKRSSDILTKDFPSEKRENKVDWKGETQSNVSVETSLLQKADGSMLGTFTPKYRVRDWNTTLTAELKTNRDFKAEVAIDNHFTNGLKTTISGQSQGEDLSATVGVEYRHELATFTGSFTHGQSGQSSLKTSTVVGSNGLQLGADFEYLMDSGNESALKFNATGSYSTSEFDIGVFGRTLNGKDSNILGLNYFQRVNADTCVGTEISFDTQNPDLKPKLVAVVQHLIDTDAVFKGKFDTNGKLGLSYAQRFKSSRLVLSSTIDTNNLSGKTQSSSVNLNLSVF